MTSILSSTRTSTRGGASTPPRDSPTALSHTSHENDSLHLSHHGTHRLSSPGNMATEVRHFAQFKSWIINKIIDWVNTFGVKEIRLWNLAWCIGLCGTSHHIGSGEFELAFNLLSFDNHLPNLIELDGIHFSVIVSKSEGPFEETLLHALRHWTPVTCMESLDGRMNGCSYLIRVVR
jgi:hypothetical protein